MRRAVLIEGLGIELELSKCTKINNEGFKCIHFDMLPDGTWRLTYGSGIIDDFTQVKSLQIIRED